MIDFEADLEILYSGEFTTSAVIAEKSCTGILDEKSAADFDLDSSESEQQQITFALPTHVLPNPQHGDLVLINNRNFRIFKVDLIDDGLITVLTLH